MTEDHATGESIMGSRRNCTHSGLGEVAVRRGRRPHLDADVQADQPPVPAQQRIRRDQPAYPQRSRNSRAKAASTSRSAQSSLGLGYWRRSTQTSWPGGG